MLLLKAQSPRSALSFVLVFLLSPLWSRSGSISVRNLLTVIQEKKSEGVLVPGEEVIEVERRLPSPLPSSGWNGSAGSDVCASSEKFDVVRDSAVVADPYESGRV